MKGPILCKLCKSERKKKRYQLEEEFKGFFHSFNFFFLCSLFSTLRRIQGMLEVMLE